MVLLGYIRLAAHSLVAKQLAVAVVVAHLNIRLSKPANLEVTSLIQLWLTQWLGTLLACMRM
jgi:hypothetical protein